jgi:tetrathionate reductase subunit B
LFPVNNPTLRALGDAALPLTTYQEPILMGDPHRENLDRDSSDLSPGSPDSNQQTSAEKKSNRREFLQKSVALPMIAGTTLRAAMAVETAVEADSSNELFQPEEFWKERLQAPDDGKKLGWFVDTRRCFGCHACEVSCKSENDVPLGNYIRQTFYRDVGEYPHVARLFLPMSCQHCEDAPCIKACPSGALRKESGGTVAVDYESCCGHGTCVEVCPYGAIYLDPVANQAVKCHNCTHRTDQGLEPACVPTCPSEALYFGDLNDENSKISVAINDAAVADGLVQLRGEKETRPRMWFAGEAPAEMEDRIPTEGESYNPDAYNIYNWKSVKKN